MELKDVVSIAGQSGLHKIIGQTKSGLILETLGTGKRFATGVQDKVSVLEDISMYTEEGDMKLKEVLIKLNEMEKGGEAIPDGKVEVNAQRSFLVTAIKLDSEKVYDSDIKKLLSWFHLLKEGLDFEKLKAEAIEEKATAESEENHAEVKKSATPKTPKNVAPKNIGSKSSKGAAGSQMTYRPKSGS